MNIFLFCNLFLRNFFCQNFFSKFFLQIFFFQIYSSQFFFQNFFSNFVQIFFFWGLYSRCLPVYRDKTDSMYLCYEKSRVAGATRDKYITYRTDTGRWAVYGNRPTATHCSYMRRNSLIHRGLKSRNLFVFPDFNQLASWRIRPDRHLVVLCRQWDATQRHFVSQESRILRPHSAGFWRHDVASVS